MSISGSCRSPRTGNATSCGSAKSRRTRTPGECEIGKPSWSSIGHAPPAMLRGRWPRQGGLAAFGPKAGCPAVETGPIRSAWAITLMW